MANGSEQNKNAKLQKYIKQVLAIRDRQENQSLSKEDFKRIALEIGISEDELHQAEQEIQSSLMKGLGYLKIEHWKDAIDELNVACALDYDNKDSLIALANAYYGYWKQTGEGEYKQRALNLAKQCINIDPLFQPAFELLDKIRRESRKADFKKYLTILVIVIIIAVAVGIFIVSHKPKHIESSPAEKSPAKPPVKTQPEQIPEIANEHLTTKENKRCFTIGTEKKLPVIWQKSKLGDLNPKNLSSVIIYYKDAISYRLNGTMEHKETTIYKLNLKLNLLDTENQLLSEKIIKAISFHPPHRPGDTIPFSESVFIKNAHACVEQAILSVDYLENKESAIPDTTSIEPLWKTNKTSHTVEIYKRVEQLSYNEIFKNNQYRLTLAIKNNSPHAISNLKINIVFLKNGQQVKPLKDPLNRIFTGGKYIVRKSGPSMPEGEQRLISFNHAFKEANPFDEMQVVIIEIE